MFDISKYYNENANKYFELQNSDSFKFQKIALNSLNSQLNEVKKDVLSILDIGCGTGYFTKFLSERFESSEIQAIDISENMLKNAKKYLKNNKNIKFINGDFLNHNFETNKFDLIFSGFVFHYFDDNEFSEIMKKCSSILKSSGRLIFVVLDSNYIKSKEISLGKDFNYHENRVYSSDFLNKNDSVKIIYRKYQLYVQPLIDSGLILTGVDQPGFEINDFSIFLLEGTKK